MPNTRTSAATASFARRGAACRRLQRAPATQHRERGFRDKGAVLLPEIAVAAEEGRQRLIRRAA
jgi:hypothetical protein